MPTIREANLPGVGHKFEMETSAGDRLTIVIHDDGTRELYHFLRKSLDRVASVVTLTDAEARQAAGIIGGLAYVPKALTTAEIVVDDLVLEWHRIASGSYCVGRTIGAIQPRTRSGASIVSIIEPDGMKRTNPGAETVLAQGATVIIAGDRKTNAALKKLLSRGEE
jgi:TrkA domain protein